MLMNFLQITKRVTRFHTSEVRVNVWFSVWKHILSNTWKYKSFKYVWSNSAENGGIIFCGLLNNSVRRSCVKELQSKWPREFGKDVSRTSAYGSVKAKYIYHAAIGKCRNQQSIQASVMHLTMLMSFCNSAWWYFLLAEFLAPFFRCSSRYQELALNKDGWTMIYAIWQVSYYTEPDLQMLGTNVGPGPLDCTFFLIHCSLFSENNITTN